jgi:hypothetical protein
MNSSVTKPYSNFQGERPQVPETPLAERRAIKKREVVYALTVLVIGILFFATAV